MRIETNGISVHYSIEGPENGPVVVLSHSLAANLAMWDWQMPVLGDYRVVRYDTRGHGGTDAPAGEYTLETLADDLFGLLDALNLEAVHYIGLSMGGMIGQTAALKDQGRFLSLRRCVLSRRLYLPAGPHWRYRISRERESGPGL
jgi:pimeloyl-ACP methyl ester carboxylesterase